MIWLVVGANGQLGKALTFTLEARGINFIAYGSRDLDIRSKLKTRNVLTKLRPSVVINAAAWTDVDRAETEPDSAFSVNAEGAINLAIAAKNVQSVYMQVSTDYVFSGPRATPWQPEDTRVPTSIYGMSKAEGEIGVLAEYSEASYIFRTAWLYSPWGKNFAKTMTRLALSGATEVRVVGDQIGQPTSALDLARQIIDAVSIKLPFGIYHATNSGQASWFEFAQEIFRLCGQDSDFDRVVQINSSELVRPANRPTYSVLGHDAWEASSETSPKLPAMRNWKVALNEVMPTIKYEIMKEFN
jgi:dTDP-4-dehydrorhamnose reductase